MSFTFPGSSALSPTPMFIAIDSRVDERVLVIHLDATIPAFTVALAFFLLAPVPILKAKLDDDNDFLMTFINCNQHDKVTLPMHMQCFRFKLAFKHFKKYLRLTTRSILSIFTKTGSWPQNY